MTASTANLWAVAGLVYALAGAALLALSVFGLPRPASAEAGQDWHKATGRWLDGRIGAALIVAGFFLQMTGAVGTSTLNGPAALVLLGLALAAGYYGLSRDLLIDNLVPAADVAAVAAPSVRADALPSAPPAAATVIVVPVVEETTVVEAETVVVDLRPRESTG